MIDQNCYNLTTEFGKHFVSTVFYYIKFHISKKLGQYQGDNVKIFRSHF